MEFWNISEVINGGIGPAPNWKKTTNNSTNTTDIFEEISVTSPVTVSVPFVTLLTEVSFAAIKHYISHILKVNHGEDSNCQMEKIF